MTLSVKVNNKSSQGSSFSGFGTSSFPGNFKSKDFEIHDFYRENGPSVWEVFFTTSWGQTS
jgi:hypothetical protein